MFFGQLEEIVSCQLDNFATYFESNVIYIFNECGIYLNNNIQTPTYTNWGGSIKFFKCGFILPFSNKTNVEFSSDCFVNPTFISSIYMNPVVTEQCWQLGILFQKHEFTMNLRVSRLRPYFLLLISGLFFMN